MFWMERVLPLLITLSAYAVWFKFAGLWEKHLDWWIDPEDARNITLWVGRIALGLIHLAAVLTGIVCSTGLVLVILFLGVPFTTALVAVPVGFAAFAIQSVTSRLTEADEEYAEEEQLARLVASLGPMKDAP